MTLRDKFHLASSGLILALVVGMMATLATYEKSRLLAQFEQEQLAELDKLARVFGDNMLVQDEAGLFRYIQNLLTLSSPRIAYAGVVFDDGMAWIYSKPNKPIAYVDPQDPSVVSILESRRLLSRTLTFEDHLIHEVSKPVERLGYVRLGYSDRVLKSLYRQTINRTWLRLLGVDAVAIVVGLLFSALFSRRLVRPIEELMAGADAIAMGKKGVQIPIKSKDELGRLTGSFNHMSQELSKLDEMKDEFMSHVTHELRSPLTSIIATVELLAEMPKTQEDPKLKRSVDRLMYGSERLNKLVDNILDSMRLEAGKMPFDIQPTDVRKLLVEMADFFEPRAAEKGLTIKASLSESLPWVMADAERVRQILSNLIYNAIKFTNRGGITLLAAPLDEYVQVTVRDTGVGIPKEKIGRLFQKFETLKDVKDRVEKPVPGTGLGLNIVQNSVKAQGGKIWVDSDLDKGSEFHFTLPLARVAGEALTGASGVVLAPVPAMMAVSRGRS